MEQVAVITGGTSGIGLATAKHFAANGYDVAICARTEARLREVKAEIEGEHGVRCLAHACDLTERSAIDLFAATLRESFPAINVLINNAGDGTLATIDGLSPEDFERMLGIHIRAPFYLTRALLPNLTGGVIVNLSSLASTDPFPGLGHYGACKAWIDLWTKVLSTELASQNIRSVCIRPGAVATPLLTRAVPEFPLEQALRPEDVAEVIYGVVQPEFRHVSGEAIAVERRSTE